MIDGRWSSRIWTLLAALAVSATPLTVRADQDFVPYGRVRYDYNSNIFALPDPSAALTAAFPTYPTRQADHVTTYFGGFDSTLPFDRQTLIVNAEGRKVRYNRLTDIDHSEYTLSGDFKWELADWSSGDLRYSEVKQLAPFADRLPDGTNHQPTAIAIQTERIADATALFALSADWSVTPHLRRRALHSPEPGLPDFTLREDIGELQFRYAGLGPMRVGINLEKLADKYQGVAGVPDVAQVSVLAALDYKVTGLTTLDATLGLTKRTQGVLVDAKKAWTGSLAYRRQLTAKTSVNAQVTRAFNSYVFAGTSELDTTEAIGADWEVTRKIAVTIGYQHTKSDFLNDGTAVNANNPQDLALLGRLDKVDLGIVAINYSPLRWLTIQPHYNRLRRNSTQLQLSYNDTIIGIDVTVKRTYP